MGTVIDLMIEHPKSANILNKLIQKLTIYEKRFSANDPDSELMAVNQAAGVTPVSVHKDLYQLIKVGKEHSICENSFLNIAIGPLVQTWRIGFNDARIPTEEEIMTKLKLTNPHAILLNDQDRSVYLKEAGMLIDLGSLAKGFIADLVIEYLKKLCVTSALVNLGGNIMTLGRSRERTSGLFCIGIKDPTAARNQYLLAVNVYNQTVVTSGIYERNMQKNGHIYHHILDPNTGYPVTTNVISLTIISKASLDAEIWTTRLFGKSAKEIIEYLELLEGISGIIVTTNHTIYYSKELEERIIHFNY